MARTNGKAFNRDIVLSRSARLLKDTSGGLIEVVDSDGNIDAPLTTTNLTTSGNTTLGDASGDTVTINGTSTFLAPVTVGVDDTGHDVKFFGATSGKSWLWDESADKMIVTGTSTLDGDVTLGTSSGIVSGTANGIVPIIYAAVQNAVSTATAIGVTSYFTTLDTTSGALALTLASGTFKGQMRKVQMIVDNGDGTLTFNSTSTIVFADVGDTAELIWTGSAWVVLALYNIVDGATAPVYTP